MSAVADFFAALPARAAGHPEKTRGLHDTYLFDVGPAGSWTVTVDDGTVSVAEGDTGAATCTIVTNEDTFIGIASGRQNPAMAFRTGKGTVSGDRSAAMRLKSVF